MANINSLTSVGEGSALPWSASVLTTCHSQHALSLTSISMACSCQSHPVCVCSWYELCPWAHTVDCPRVYVCAHLCQSVSWFRRFRMMTWLAEYFHLSLSAILSLHFQQFLPSPTRSLGPKHIFSPPSSAPFLILQPYYFSVAFPLHALHSFPLNQCHT